VTRLEQFCAVLLDDVSEAYVKADALGHQNPKAYAEKVAARRIRDLARAIDGDTQGPAQTYLDEPA